MTDHSHPAPAGPEDVAIEGCSIGIGFDQLQEIVRLIDERPDAESSAVQIVSRGAMWFDLVMIDRNTGAETRRLRIPPIIAK
nr:hypothetical protein [Pseudoxanthomonas sp.]